MNKIYKVVWNTVRNCYVVGSELISSKSGRHSASNGKSSSLKVTLTVLALCGMTALGSGVAPAYAADAGATTAMNQYVALKYDNSNNQNEKVEQTNGKRQIVTTFNGKRYIKVNSGVNDNTGRPIYYWVREGYSLTMVDGQPYTLLSSNGRRADISWTGDANAKPSDILESVTSTHVQTNVTTNVGETLQQVNAGTYAGVTNSGGTEVDGDWDYIVKDSSWKGVVNASNYRNGYANLISNGKPKGFVRTTDAGSKLAWNANLNAYTYNGKVVDYSNIYVIDGEIGVFTNASGSEVYTGTVFGKNNEVLMTVKKSDGKYYSYWGAEVNDAGATMDTYRVAEYQKDLNVLRDNDFALYHNDIKSVDMSTDASSATISLMRNGDGTSSPAVDGTLTITNGGGAGGKDTYVRISNTTNGQEVSKTFSTGSKVEAVKAMESATDITGLTINGETYNIKTGQSYTAGDNVSIKDNKISASNNYVSSARLNNYDELILEREGLNDLTVDLSRLTHGLSSTDYQLVANKNSSDGKYTVRNGEVTLTVKDMNNLSNKEVKTITISGLAGQEDLTHYFSVDAPMTNPLDPLGNYNNEGAQGNRSIAIGVKASATGDFSVAIGSGQNTDGAKASGDYATAVGNGSLAEGKDSTALGYNAAALGEDSVAIGYTSIANGKNSMALGVEARAGNNGAQADYATAVGALAHVNAVDGTALGQNAEVNSERGTALGSTSKVHAAKGTAIGAYTSVTAEGGVAIGQESVANRAAGMKGYAPVGEAGTSPVWKATDGAVSLGSDPDGSSPHTRQITNLAAGTVDTDAVNVAQLKRARVELTNGTNTTVKSTNDQTDGHVIYSVDVSNEAIQKATDITGNNGIDVTSKDVNGVKTYKVSAKLSDNLLVNDAGNIDLASVLHVGSKITVDGNKGEITGLTNKTLNVEGFATQGRAATEEQLSAMQNRLTTDDKYVTSGTIDKTKGTMNLNVANVSTPVSITGLTDYQVTQDSSYDAANHRLTLNLKDTMNASNPAQSVTFDGIASTTDVAKATTEVKGGTNIASVVKTDGANGNAVYTVNAKGTTVSTDDNFVLDTTAAGNNVTNYGLSLADSITIGKGESSHPIVIDGNKGEITGLTNKTLDVEGFATKGRAATEEQLKAVDEKAAKAASAKTIVEKGKNMEVTKTDNGDGSSTYTVGLADNVSLGNNAIQLNGSDGSISATSGTSSLNFNDKGLSLSNGKNSTVINGGTITVNGGESVISGTQATFGKIKLNAESGSTITGLSNTTTKYDGFATAGRAATEEQLKEVSGQASEAIETAGKGWNLTTNKGTATNIKPDGTVDFSSSNDNLVISNAGANLSFSLSDNLDLTNNKDKKGSVKVGENTALSNELLQVGKDVSLTASALNVGNSSLTTSALMVGGLTYINSSGLNANNRVISNVATGVADTDAVNVGQLKSAISGSQVSINAGLGIIVEKQGNQYTIKTNIEGVENEHGTIHVTDSDQSLVANSETVTPAHAKRLNTLMMADMMAVTEATEPEKTTLTGPKAFIQQVSKPVTLNTDDLKWATLNDGETIYFQGDGNIETTTTLDTNRNSDTIKFALKKDIKVDSIEAKSGDQINIKSEVNMNNQKITNLKDGEIAEGSKDAVNGGQLYNTNQAVIANAENINSLSHSLNKLDSRINRVGAGAAALAALHPLDFDPDNKWDFAAGYGNYAGANAVAIGTYYRPNENTMFSIGGSFGGGENMINAGVSFKLGSGSSGITTSKTVMAKKIKEQDELLKAQDAKMKEQDEKIAKLEALVAQQGEMIQQALGKK